MRATLVSGSGWTVAATMVVIGLLSACGPPRSRLPAGFEGRTHYLCCTLRFNHDRDASDAGYLYEPGTSFPAGTAVQIVGEADEGASVFFLPLDSAEKYHMVFRFGRKAITPHEYFQDVFLREDPRPKLGSTPEIADAIARGEIMLGMTKAEVIAARGYPPRHRTPSLEDNEWLFYQTRGTVMRVKFDAGTVTSAALEPAPG